MSSYLWIKPLTLSSLALLNVTPTQTICLWDLLGFSWPKETTQGTGLGLFFIIALLKYMVFACILIKWLAVVCFLHLS